MTANRQPSELEKRFQEGIKEAEDFAARFLAVLVTEI
jgi:hypothetical protein